MSGETRGLNFEVSSLRPQVSNLRSQAQTSSLKPDASSPLCPRSKTLKRPCNVWKKS